MILGHSHHLRSSPKHPRDRETNDAMSGRSRKSTPISHGNQLRRLTSSTTLVHKILDRYQRIATQIAKELTCRRTSSALDHVPLVSCRYIGLAQIQWMKESATAILPQPQPLCELIRGVAPSREYRVACLDQCLALGAVLRSV